MAVNVRIPNGPLYKDIDGVIRLNANFTVEMLRDALSYEPTPDDNFVVTFPKCGTTWAQQISYLIFNKGVPPPSAMDLFTGSPYIEMLGADSVRQMARPGVIKTHLPYHLMPKHPEAKYLYICRNPKDACVSFFHFTRGFAGYEFADGKFDDYFEVFISGQTDYGDYFDHVMGWYERREDQNVLFLHYEDMKTHLRQNVLKIARFFDESCYKTLLKSDEILENVIKFSDIEYMRVQTVENFKNFFTKPIEEDAPKALKVLHEATQANPSTANFVRKGVVGDWKNHFSPEQNARLEQKILERCSKTDLIDTWRQHGVM
ncbi:sulfotransferase 1C2-like [Haemaphysalis longicornis]